MKFKSLHWTGAGIQAQRGYKNATTTLEVKQIEVLYAIVLAKRKMVNSGLNKCYLRRKNILLWHKAKHFVEKKHLPRIILKKNPSFTTITQTPQLPYSM